jgi:hypothetical protein
MYLSYSVCVCVCVCVCACVRVGVRGGGVYSDYNCCFVEDCNNELW